MIEILLVSAPFEWWLSRKHYAKLNDIVMGVIYSPLLVLTAWVETRQAEQIRWNRRHGEDDEGSRQEWEYVADEVNFDLDDAWKVEVQQSTPDITVDSTALQVRHLQEQVAALTEAVNLLTKDKST